MLLIAGKLLTCSFTLIFITCYIFVISNVKFDCAVCFCLLLSLNSYLVIITLFPSAFNYLVSLVCSLSFLYFYSAVVQYISMLIHNSSLESFRRNGVNTFLGSQPDLVSTHWLQHVTRCTHFLCSL